VSSYIKNNLSKNKVLSEHHEHNHASDQNTIEAVKSKIEIKQIAKVFGSTPGQIFNEIINKILKQVLRKMPTEESIKRTIRMQRSGNNPIEPTDINNLVIEGIVKIFIKIPINMEFKF